MTPGFSRLCAGIILALATVAMLTVTSDAEARRFGGGRSFGRQSLNINKQIKPVTPPAANAASRAGTPAAGTKAAAGSTAAAAGAGAAKTGMSRWLGPLVGIAAGLGIAGLLSALGLSGAFLELLSSLVLIALLVFAVRFILRRLRGTGARPAFQGAGEPLQRRNASAAAWPAPPAAASGAMPAADAEAAAAPEDESWFIPQGFDTPGFLANAKTQFTLIQSLWDAGDVDGLREYLTDDLLAEVAPEVAAHDTPDQTEILLLNAELMGMEKVAGGHLASVRYSGMLRETPGTEASHFEEVWNLYKADGQGWLVAGIQQMQG